MIIESNTFIYAMREIARLQAENAAMLEALRPFAKYVEQLGNASDNWPVCGGATYSVRAGCFRRAAELLATIEKGGEHDA